MENSFVNKLDEWHFNQAVYNNQLNIINSKLSSGEIIEEKTNRENKYRQIMEKSLFSICPLGIGPNSIRLWESFTYNTIPVSISDDLWLPFYINIDRKELMIDIKEDDYQDILNLKMINSNKITKYQNKIMDFYQSYLTYEKFGSIIYEPFKKQNMVNGLVTLLVPWYNHIDKTSLRYTEIHKCLEINLKNKYIKTIIFFYEVSNEEEILFEDYIDPKIKIIPVITSKIRDISFNRLVRYANENLINELCIISNNDIYFDDTLTELTQLNFYKNNYFISLTRKNHDRYLDNNKKLWKPHSASQDSWIFVSPIKLMKQEINLGWIQCDNIISASYDSFGYQVINPHYSINTWHLHMYNNTNELLEKYNYNYQYQMKKIKLESIEDILKSTCVPLFNLAYNEQSVKIEDTLIKKENKLDISKLSNLKKKWILRENN